MRPFYLFTFVWVAAASLTLIISSCTTSPPQEFKAGGRTYIQTHKKLLGVPIASNLEEIQEPKTQTEKTQERQSAAAFWFGATLLGLAPIFVIIGYIVKGWKFWGILAAICATLGACFWSFENLVPLLKWPAYGIGGAVVLWTMWKAKDFSLFEKKKRPSQRVYSDTYTN